MGQTMADSINPTGNKKSSTELLPKYYRTDANKKFLQATVDQLVQPGTVKKINGYVGRQNSKSTSGADIFIKASDANRQNYQLEPSLVINDTLGNTTFFKDYQDYINQLQVFGANVKDHARLNDQEFYSWDPHINWDKFVNFQNYYWLPYGPDVVIIPGEQLEIDSTYTVKIVAEADNNVYVFTPDAVTPNPSIRLYRGLTYRFQIASPDNPFSIKTARTPGSRDRYVTPGLIGNGIEDGTIEFTIPYNSPDILYYVSDNDINLGGVFQVVSPDENTVLDLTTSLLGKKTYTLPDGTPLTNGMKVSFSGEVTPAEYSSGQYYVEGVGTEIKLINEALLELLSPYTQSEAILFDSTPFDSLPFSDATSLAGKKDYIIIQRSASDQNPWSRYNRWFHKDAIEASAAYNGKIASIDQSARAVRPIIEFESNIRLFNFGTQAVTDVDLIDNFTVDIFSKIEGQLGYNIDGVNLAQGQRILFTTDTDIRVRNKIYKVDFLILDGVRQIHLVEDGIPAIDQVALIRDGIKNRGEMYWYNGDEWVLAQQKLAVNQPPLFDVVDNDGISYGDKSTYDGSTFTGTKLFSYKVRETPAGQIGDKPFSLKEGSDATLGFPLSFRNIENIGDIVFRFDLASDQFQYKLADTNIISKNINSGYLIKTPQPDQKIYVNGWQKCNSTNIQAAVRIYKDSNQVNNFNVDMFDNIRQLDDLVVRVYVNGIRLSKTEWTMVASGSYKKIVLATDIKVTDVLTIKAYTSQPVNSNGFYEIPINLQNNPLNSEIQDFTLGEVIDHVNSIVENTPTFEGVFPGVSNLRDIGNVTQYGTRFVQHSGPVSLSLYHITSQNNNIVRAIESARDNYTKFKRNFISVADSIGVDSDPVRQVNLILQTINKDKPSNFPYYFSDMLAYSGSIRSDLTVIDFRIKTYPLNGSFDPASLSNKAVLVYLNQEQLLYKKEYTFDDQGFVNILVDIETDDSITIYEFENTNGCFVPPTPTKLGIWPKYEPKIYLDTSLVTPRTVIQGHDGSLMLAYGDYRDNLILELEKRIYNNIKIDYDSSIFNIHDFIPAYNRPTAYSREEFNEVLSSNFFTWSSLIDKDFTKSLSYDRNNSLTFNYRDLSTPDGATPLPGYWKGIHRWMLDTDRPNLCPWEMLGFSEEPTWWQDLYGPAPYTSDNLILWNDIADGLIREPGLPPRRNSQYARPYIADHIPVDNNGNIVSPLTSGLATGTITSTTAGDFVFGDVGPVESAWRRSSHYPFSMLITFMLLHPSKTLGLALDRSRIFRNQAGQLVYRDTGLRIKPQDIVLPSIFSSTTDVRTSGIINYVTDYILSDNLKSYAEYSSDLVSIKAQLSHRIGSFTSKEKFNLLLDSKTPLTSGSVFVPQEDYDIVLNTSSPIKKITYSGVIITKLADGFVVRGYSKTQPYFKYYPFTKSGVVINIGGISESFSIWTVRTQYAAGKIVSFANRYYRVNALHTTTELFNPALYELLPSLPIIGGRDAYIRQAWARDTELTVPYGTKFKTVQDVVDFLLGYGEYLKDQGFIFDDYNSELNAITNWETSAKEFMFWTTQNWSTGNDKWEEWSPDQPTMFGSIVRYNGDYYRAIRTLEAGPIFDAEDFVKLDGLSSIGSSVISLSPAAARLTFSTPLCVVDDIRNPFNNYEIFKVDGTPIQPNFLNNYREDNAVSYTPVNDAIYGATFYLVQKEQVVVLKNTTLFNDTIYNPPSGYRQERIKVSGYISSDWKGDFNIPGFIFDQAVISEWEMWKDYALGDIVRFKQFYYSANKFISGNQTFNSVDWIKLDSKPRAQILPNWTYKANQFEDFYSLDSDNFDGSQQAVAQHLIGYQKRQYLSNIIKDDVSEFKFYQGLIVEKGTQNVLNKLFDVLSASGQESITFYEEWALRVGQYGANASFENIEFIIDEQEVKNNPQGFELVNQKNSVSPDFISRQTPNDVYLKPIGYNNNPWPISANKNLYLRTPGYVRSSDVKLTLRSIDDILNQPVSDFKDGDYVWVGFEGREWNVYRYTNLNVTVTNITYRDGIASITLENNIDLAPGTVIAIDQAAEYNGFFKVSSTLTNVINFNVLFKVQPKEFKNLDTVVIAKLSSQRASSIDVADLVFPSRLTPGELLWTDDTGDGKWATWQHTPAYSSVEISNTSLSEGLNYGRQLLLSPTGNLAVVSTAAGELIVYDKAGPTAPWLQRQTITAPFISKDPGFGNNPTPDSFTGDVLAISSDGQWLATGTPLAGKNVIGIDNNVVSFGVCSTYKGVWSSSTNYVLNDIVLRNSVPYKAIANSTNRPPETSNIVPINTILSGTNVTGTGTGATFNISANGSNYNVSVNLAGTGYAVGNLIKIPGLLLAGLSPTNDLTIRVISIVSGAINGPIANVSVTGNAQVFWEELGFIPVDSSGSNSNGFNEQGVISLYSKDANNIFSLVATILSPTPTAGEKFGSNLVFGDDCLFVTAAGYNNRGAVYKLTHKVTVEASTSYNPIGSLGTTIALSSTTGIEVGMYLRGTGFDSNQYVAQVNTSTSSIIISAEPDSVPAGIIEFIVTEWVYDLANSFVNPSLPAGSNFGTALAMSGNNTTLAITNVNTVTDTGTVNIYYLTNGSYQSLWSVTGTDPKFGTAVTLSNDGTYLAISSILADDKKLDQGNVSIYKRSTNAYVFYQSLRNLDPEVAEFFGSKVAFMNDFQTLVVYCQGSDNRISTTFDLSATTFDNDLTKINDLVEDSGRVDIYDRYNNNWIFSESLSNTEASDAGYGSGLAVGINSILVGAPYAVDQSVKSGKVYEYRKLPGKLSWNILHKENDRVDLKKIKRAFLYNKATNKLVTYLDTIDSTQGKIPGIADVEIKYKTFYDPATYSSGTSEVTVDEGMAWTKAYVGTLWWDLRTAKFFDSHDESLVYRNSTWNTIFPGASIDVYEWVQTTLTPDRWNTLADTEEGITSGISGTSLYGNDVYSVVKKYDNISKTFKNTYYFWVKNKKTIPNVPNRNMSAQSVVDLIENPRGSGYKYLALTGSNSFSLVNIKSLLEDKDIVLSVEYWTSPYTDRNSHSEWKIINNSTKTELPNSIESKWVDSLCGKDIDGRLVPDTSLPPKLKYGIEVRPRQGMFINRFEALKQYIEQVNRILVDELIVENRDITKLNSFEREPSTITGLYDSVLDTDAELRFANIGTYGKPLLSPIIVNGRITGIDILQRGSGYIIAPYFTITGSGTGAKVRATINTRGEITGYNVISKGSGYDDNTLVTVRNYTVLVHQDSVANGNWSLYSYEPSTQVWSRVQSQSYDVRNYWYYIDWYAPGFNDFTVVNHSVNSFVELAGVESTIGQTVKIRVTSLGTWVLLMKYADSSSVDWTQNYKVIGREKGTIQFSSSLYNFANTPYGFDGSLYDSSIFDNSASTELRIILNSLKDDILIDTLKQDYLNLFFASVRYVFSEQNYVDWIFKTSFVKAQHSVGELKQKVTYNNDNLENFEDYINEVKPYRTTVREYVSAYSKMEQSQLSTTDFDIPTVFENNQLIPINTTVTNGIVQADNNKIITYPWKHWYDNLGFTVTSLKVVDGGSGYRSEPVVRFVGGTGSGATGRAFYTNGKINRVVLLSKGSGYLSAPTIILEGGLIDGGTPGKVVAIIGNSVVRSNAISIKFDRTTQNYFVTKLEETESFTGTGSQLQFPLIWAPDVRIGKSTVLIKGVEALRSDYTLTIIKSVARGYTSYSGAITFKVAPAAGLSIEVKYIKDWSVLNAADRIQHYYDPATGELGKDLAQLMTGVDYGGVTVQGLGFDVGSGWGSVPYYTDKWGSFDETFDDFIVTVSANTHSFTLPYVPPAGTLLNVYYSSKNTDTYVSNGFSTVYNFNINNIFPPAVTVSTDTVIANSPTNIAGSYIVTVNTTTGIRVGDVLSISPNVVNTLGYETKVTQIISSTQVRIDQILFKDIAAGTTATFRRLLVDPTDCTINPNGTVFLNQAITAGSVIDITSFFDPVRLDDENFSTGDGTGEARDALAVLYGELAVLTEQYDTLLEEKKLIEDNIIDLNSDLVSLNNQLDAILLQLDGMSTSNPLYNGLVSQANILEDNIDDTVASISTAETSLLNKNIAISAKQIEKSQKQQDVTVAQTEYNSLTPLKNTTAIMQTVESDGIADSLVDPTYKTFTIPATFVVDDGDRFIWRKTTSDGSLTPQDADYDTALSGGEFLSNSLISATGIAADDIIVDGDGFVTPTSSPATEEVVPGQVVDSVAIKVYDRPSSGSANIKVDSYIADGVTTDFLINQQPNSPTAVVVKFTEGQRDVTGALNSVSTIKTLTEDYVIDYENRLVKFAIAPDEGQLVSLFSFGFNGSNILDLDYFIGDGSQTEFVTKAPWVENVNFLVYVNGLPAEPGTPALFKTDDTYDSANRAGLFFSVPPSAGSLINYVIISGAEQTYSITKTERLQGNGSSLYNLQNPIGDSLPVESNMIVRVGQRILSGPNNSYFTIKGTQINYTIDPAKYLPYSLSITDIVVYADGKLLQSGVDYIVELSGITVKIKQSIRQQYLNKELVISIRQTQEYEYIPPSGFIGPRIQFAKSYDNSDVIEIISSFKHDILNIQRTAASVTSNLVLTPDTTEYYNYRGLAGGVIQLDRAVIDENYVWVIKDGALLTPSADFKLNEDRRSIKLALYPDADTEITIITFGSNVLTTGISYMQFKDMLNRTHYKRLNANKQTRLAKDLTFRDTVIEVEDASNFDTPSIPNNKPGIIEIRGERIEFFTLETRVVEGVTTYLLGQLRRGTLGTGVSKVHKLGSFVQDIGASETLPYVETPTIDQITSDGTNIVPLTFTPTKSDTSWSYAPGYQSSIPSNYGQADDIEVFVGGYTSTPWASAVVYAVDDIVEIGSYTYRCVVAHTSSSNFFADKSNWQFFVGNIRLKKKPYRVHNVDVHPASTEGDVQMDAEFSVDGETNQLRLTHKLSFGTRVTVIRRNGTDWDSIVNILEDDSKIARFLKSEPGIWYTTIGKYENKSSLASSYDSTNGTFDSTTITMDQG
jgi:hypothetical protein